MSKTLLPVMFRRIIPDTIKALLDWKKCYILGKGEDNAARSLAWFIF